MEIEVLHLKEDKDVKLYLNKYDTYSPLVAAFDTEATGLDIIKDKPFVFQSGWYNQDTDTIYVGLIDLEETPWGTMWIEQWHDKVQTAPVYLAHNTKFDLHMLQNIDVPYKYPDNLSDTQFYIRFAHDNIPVDRGGVNLGLKDYAAKYIDPQAKHHDSLISKERSLIAKRLNTDLRKRLGWKAKDFNEFFKDKTITSEDFPTVNDWLKYCEWRSELPKVISDKMTPIDWKVNKQHIPYSMVDRKVLLEYAAMDIVWTIRVYLQTAPVVEARQTTKGLEIENKCIMPLWEMERQGYCIDQDYVMKSFYRMRDYIRQRRQDLIDAAGMQVTCNQNKVLLELLNDNGINVTNTNADTLKRLHKDYPGNHMQDVVDLVLELRTLEKWFSTYLMRFIGKDKIHTQINQVGAASLRMSSDFQQFPNGKISSVDGEELFYPRRAIKVDPKYDAIVMLDYSQIELRVQALYTILVGEPDTNLCRAYMPYKCYTYHNDVEKVYFDHKNIGDIKHAYDFEWFKKEDDELWIPTDVHGATTEAAFDITPDHPDFKDLRSIGKRVNFAKNYGAQRGKIAEMFPEYPEDMIDKIDQAYYKAFPGIKNYQQYCYELANYQPYATNLFGVRYWNVSGHNLINMLIQGSSATLLKQKIIKIHKFLKENNYKSKMLMPIHDEIQFNFFDDELHIVPKIKEIMEDWDVYVPIVADQEITRTYWSEKEELEWHVNTAQSVGCP